MKRKIKLSESAGLHEIKNKKRICPVEVKKRGIRLGRVPRWKKMTKAVASLSAVAILGLGGFSLGSAFFGEANRNVVDLDYGSVVYEVEKGETYDAASADEYSAIDIFGRLNWKFAQQTKWYGEMHGIVSVPMINMEQDVTTYKQYDNDMLISADLTKSSMVNAARQFCYLKDQDRVIWREAADKKAQDGLNTVWKTGDPFRAMTISGADGFKAQNGLPAYELSVYVIEPDSVLDSSVESNDDGTYTVSFEMNPKNWVDDGVTKGATAYYINQMIFTGGLPAAPVFDSLSVSFTYNSDWEVLHTTVHEAYSAQYGPISAPCVSDSTTVYEYNTARAESTVYAEYFSNYLDGPLENGTVQKTLEATDYLVAAFGDVLAGPASLSLDLDLNGTKTHGVVYLDISGLDLANLDLNNLDLGGLAARVKLGDAINVWVDGGAAYIRYGDLKVSLTLSELIEMISGTSGQAALTSSDTTDAGGEENDLLGAIVNGELVTGEGTAELHCTLPLLGLNVGVDFYFFQDEDNNVSLNYVSATLPIDGFPVGIRAAYTEEEVPVLEESEKAAYPAVLPYAKTAMEIFTGDALNANITYSGNGFTVDGDIGVIIDPFAVNGTVRVTLGGVSKTVGIAYAGDAVYINLDGIKLSANVKEAIALVTQFLGEGNEELSLDISTLISTVLSPEFAANLSTSEEDGTLHILVDVTEILKALGLGLDLGTAEIKVGNETITASVYGVTVAIGKGETFDVDTANYTEIVKYASELVELFRGGALQATVKYGKEGDDLKVSGTIDVDFKETKNIKAKADLRLQYKGAEKEIKIYYGQDLLLLDLAGIKVKANVNDALELVKGELAKGEPASTTEEEDGLLKKLLSLTFGDYLAVTDENDTLTVCIAGTELLKELGIEFNLGEVKLEASGGTLSAHALGADIAVSKGQGVEAESETDYADILPAVKNVLSLVKGKILKATVNYGEAGDKLQVGGTISVDFKDTKNVLASGTIALTYIGVTKNIQIAYAGNAVYLDLDGVKLSADVKQAVELVKSFIGAKDDNSEADKETTDLLEQILGLDFGTIVTANTENETLKLTLDVTEVLKALGLGLDLGTAEIKVGNETVTASVYGVTVVIGKGDAFDVDTANYTEIVKYASELVELFRGGALQATVKYGKEGDDLKVSGTIDVDFKETKNIKAKADLRLQYKGAEKEIKIYYGQDLLLLDLAGIKVKANVNDALELVKGELAKGEPASTTEEEDGLLKKLLSLTFGDYLAVTDENDTLTVCIAGTELLKELGIEFNLGEVKLEASGGTLSAHALGADIAVSKGQGVEAESETDYADILPAVKNVLSLVKGKILKATVNYGEAGDKLQVGGTISVDFKDTKNVLASGTIALTYIGVTKNIQIAYAGNAVYLDLDGVKLSADVKQAVELVKSFIGAKDDNSEADKETTDLLEQILGLDFGTIVTANTENETLKLTLDVTEVLKALGLGLDLGTAEIKVGNETITASVYGVTVAIGKGDAFNVDTANYTEIVKYASELVELFRGGALQATVKYGKEGDDLKVSGTIDVDFKETKNIKAKADLRLQYKGAEKEIKIYYGQDLLLLDLAGIKVKANVNDALELVKGELAKGEPASTTEEEDGLLKKLLSLTFGDYLAVTDENDTLTVCIAGTELLKELGIEFNLGEVKLEASGGTLSAHALGADIAVSKGQGVEAESETDYADILPAVKNVLSLVKGKILKATVNYGEAGDKLQVGGTISVDFKDTKNVLASGTIALTYIGVTKNIQIAYAGNAVYLDLDGVKLSADVKQAVELVKSFIGAKDDNSEADKETTDLLEQILGLDFGTIVTANTENETLKLTLDVTEVLKALGLGLDLGTAEIKVGNETVTASVYGVTVVIGKGDAFDVDTANYTEIVKYASELVELFRGGALQATVKYGKEGDDLKVSGTIDVDFKETKNIKAKADLRLQYKGAEKEIKIYYGQDLLLLDLAGIKVKANVNDALELVKGELAKGEPASTTEEEDGLLKKLLSLTFGDYLAVTDENDTLTVCIAGTELLKELGIEFNLGEVKLEASGGTLSAHALGADIAVSKGQGVEAESETDYADILPAVKNVLSLVKGKILKATVNYGEAGDKLQVGGTISVDFKDTKNVLASGTIALTYIGVTKNIQIAYAGNAVYLDLDGVKLSADVKQAVELVKSFIGAKDDNSEADKETTDLLEQILGLDFGTIVTANTENETLKLTLDVTEVLKALGLGLDLGTAEIKVGNETVTASVYGVTVVIGKGDAFDVDTANYTEIVKYASELVELFRGGALQATVKYGKEGDDLKVSGTIDVDFKETKNIKAKADLRLQYKGAEKEIKIYYGQDLLLLDLAGIKVKANVNDALELVKGELAKGEPASTTEEEDGLLKKLLSLTFGDYLAVTDENDTLTVCIAGTELLKELGIEFNLGEVKLEASGGTLSAHALGADIAVSKGQGVEAESETDYADILPAVKNVLSLVKGKILKATVNYGEAGDKLQVGGTISVDFKDTKNVLASGTIALTYIGVTKNIQIAYAGNAVYLDLDGVKLSADVKQAVELVKSFIGAKDDNSEADKETTDLLEQILGLDFGTIVTANTENETLKLTLDVTEVLKALGLGLDLGTAEIKVGNETITASVYGVTVAIGKGDAFNVKTEDYIEVMPYVKAVADLVRGEALSGEVTFQGGGLTVHGTIVLNLGTLAAQANLTLTYGKINKTIGILYASEQAEDETAKGFVYLTLDGLKLKVSVDEGVDVIKGVLPASAQGDQQSTSLLEKLLSLTFGDVINPEVTGKTTDTAGGETDDTADDSADTSDGLLTLTLAGDTIIKAFIGKEFSLGDIVLTVGTDGTITAAAESIAKQYSVHLTLKGGTAFTATTEGYYDLTPVLQKLPAIMSAKAIQVNGSLTLGVKSTNIVLDIEQGVISWQNGLNVYLDATLTVLGTVHKLNLNITDGDVQFAYGAVGVRLYYTELSQLENALVAVYERVRGIVQQAIGETENPLPEIGSLADLLDLLKGAEETAQGVEAAVEKANTFDWTELVQGLTIGASEMENGVAGVSYKGVSLDVLDELDAKGLLGLVIGFEADGVTIGATLHANVFNAQTPSMPEIDYLTANEIADLIDYLGAAVGLIAEPQVKITANGKIYDGNAEKYPSGVKYNVNAAIEYHSGGKFPFLIDTTGKTLTVNTDLYFKAKFDLTPTSAEDDGVYLDLVILDSNADEILDFYVTVSTVASIGTGGNGYEPLSLHVTSDELMTILAGACAMLDIDAEIIQDYLIKQWIPDVETVGQLRAFGFSLKEMINDLVGKEIFKNDETGEAMLTALEGMQETDSEGQTEADPEAQEKAPARRGFIKSVHSENGNFVITLDSQEIYGDDRDDIVLELKKVKDESGVSHLQAIGFNAIYDKAKNTGAEFRVEIDHAPYEKPTAIPEVKYDFAGIDDLILAFAKSATHKNAGGEASGAEDMNEYILNRNFYVDGTIELNALSMKNVKINMALSVDIDEQGDVGVTVHIEYGKESFLVDIFRSAGWVDLTIKNKMVYIKRITDPNSLDKREEIYRIMPLSNFMSDILNQVDFIFNFGSTISDALKNNAGGGSSGGSGSGTAAKQDVGTLIATYLSKYVFTRGAGEEGGDLWNVVINGAGLAPDVLSDIVIDIKSDKERILRTLDVSLSVVKVLDLKAVLRLRNPQGKMDVDAQDVVDHTVQSTLDHAMGSKLADPAWSWEKTTYLEGKLGKFVYKNVDSVVATQYVVYDTQTGEFFDAKYDYPSFDTLPDPGEGYHWEWVLPEDRKAHNQTIEAKLAPNHYTITLKSEYGIDGYDPFGDGMWVKTFDYTYGATGVLGIGTEYINEAEGVAKKIVAFRCKEGHEITELTAWQHFASEEQIELTAVWEDIEFTVTFNVYGKSYTQQVKYGKTAVEPTDAEKNVKTGYTFSRWDGDIEQPIKQDNIVFTAKYDPNKYELTFVSDYEIKDWNGVTFSKRGDGKYVATYLFTYDSSVSISAGVKTEDGAHILRGFKLGESTYFDQLPNVLDKAEFTAVWAEVGVDVKFADENGNVFESLTRNKHVGETFDDGEIPAVPARDGYVGRWNIDFGSYTVPKDGDTIRAEYTPITYTILQYSLYAPNEYAKNGFKEVTRHFDSEGVKGETYYVRTLKYTYGSGTVTLEDGKPATHTEGVGKTDYDLLGFYTERFGNGTKVDTITDSLIAEIFCFNGKEGTPPADNTFAIYAHWKNITITVRYYSDVQPDIMDGMTTVNYDNAAYMLYYTDKVYSRDTEVKFVPTAVNGGSRFLAWFCNDGQWKRVTNVEEFRKDDNAATNEAISYDVALYAVWIEEIKLSVTKVEPNPTTSADWTRTYSIDGTVEGGFPVTGVSEKIYAAVGVTKTTKGTFALYGSSGIDTLAFGAESNLTYREIEGRQVGYFSCSKENTAVYGLAWERATHGGIGMQMEFSFDGASIKLVDVALVSVATYTVTFVKGDGTEIKKIENIPVNCTAEFTKSDFKNNLDFDGKITSSATVYADELAAANGIVCPQDGAADGKTAIWPHRKIEGNVTISPVFKSELQSVTYRSKVDLDGAEGKAWTPEYDESGAATGWYVYKNKSEQVYADAKITFVDASGVISEYTVQAGENIVELPGEIRSVNGVRLGKWTATSYSYDPWGVTFNAEYGEDHIVYRSAVDWDIEYDGTSYRLDANTEYTLSFGSEYTLFTPTSEGFTFLGWFTKQGDSWRKVETLQIAAEETTTYVEALWVEDIKVEQFITTVEIGKSIFGIDNSWKYRATLKFTGGKLIGPMAADSSLVTSTQINAKFYLADDLVESGGSYSGGQNKLEQNSNPTSSEQNGTYTYQWTCAWERGTAGTKYYDRTYAFAEITRTYMIAGIGEVTVTGSAYCNVTQA